MLDPYYEDELVTLFCGDNSEVMPQLDPVDLIFTSPPYNLGVSSGGGLHSYALEERKDGKKFAKGKWTGGGLAGGYEAHDDAMPIEEYEAWQHAFLHAAWTQLTPTGAIFYNHKPRVQNGELWTPLRVVPAIATLRQIVIWARAGGVNFNATHYLPTHEWILVLAPAAFRLKSKEASGVGDVWRVPQEAKTEHPAPFPVGLPARAIESVAPTSVLDPFCGSGTTLVAAKAAGVKSIGIELSERYCDIAVRRLAQGVLIP